jgi:hypothetical protein
MSQTERNLKLAVVIASVIACFTTFCVMLTYFTFKEMRKKRFMQFIFYISVCDFFMGVTSFFGFPRSGRVCMAQGVLSIYFSSCSWFWTTALSFSMYRIVSMGRSFSDVYIHIICWTLPLFLAFIPLSNTTYGSPNDSSRVQWCLIENDSHSPANASLAWSYAAYFGWLFLCSGLMIYWLIRVRILMRNRTDALSSIVRNTYDKVALYPYAMIGFWALNYICVEFRTFNSELLTGLSMIFGVSYGTASALIFLIKSEEAQRRWYDIIFADAFGYRPSTSVVPVDFEEEQYNEPFAVSSFFHSSSNSSNNHNPVHQHHGSSNNTTLSGRPLSSKHASQESTFSVNSIQSSQSAQSNRTGSSVFTLNSGFTVNSASTAAQDDAML